MMNTYKRTLDPPAPFVPISVQHPMTGRRERVEAQLDTGADISAIPRHLIDALGLFAARAIPVEGYDEVSVRLPTYVVAVEVADARFRAIEMVSIPGQRALLGRDVLNHFYARLNGPDLTFDLQVEPPV